MTNLPFFTSFVVTAARLFSSFVTSPKAPARCALRAPMPRAPAAVPRGPGLVGNGAIISPYERMSFSGS
eukprot:16433034-Heterocapsa_arctica.AAC.1